MQESSPAEASVTVRGLHFLSDRLKPASLRALEPIEGCVPSELAASLVEPVSHPTDAVTGLRARPLFRAQTGDARSASASPPLA